MEIVGDCEACGKMEEIRPGLWDKLNGRRGMQAMVINSGTLKVGDSLRMAS